MAMLFRGLKPPVNKMPSLRDCKRANTKASILCFQLAWRALLLSATMMCLQGCVLTVLTISDYGRATEKFTSPEGPAYGDTTRIYIQGEKEVDPNLLFQRIHQLPAYITLDIKDGKIVSKEVIDGQLPSAVFEYPKIKPLFLNPRNVMNKYSTWDNVFLESGYEMAFVPVVYMKNSDRPVLSDCLIYIKNPNDPNKPYELRIWNYDELPRSTSTQIALPFVCVGAVAADTVLLPVYVLGFTLYVTIGLITGGH